MKKLLMFILPLLIMGCATAPVSLVPEDYSGDVAIISDTYSNKETGSAHYYSVHKINGVNVHSSWLQTRERYYGQGRHFTPQMVMRNLMPGEQTLTIKAYRFFSTDGEGMFRGSWPVEGDVKVNVLPGEEYFVKGIVSKDVSEVWIETKDGIKVTEVVRRGS